MRWLSIFAASIVLAAASPARAHQYLDYFEYGAADLSSRGYQTARSVAEYAKIHSARYEARYQIVISAHMDTAEAAEFSDELAARRAQAMATELVVLGIEASRIRIVANGARQLARATGSNTREPLNRRLVVDVNFDGSPR